MRKFGKIANYVSVNETPSDARYFVIDLYTRKTVIPGTVTRTQANKIVALLNSYEKELAEWQKNC